MTPPQVRSRNLLHAITFSARVHRATGPCTSGSKGPMLSCHAQAGRTWRLTSSSLVCCLPCRSVGSVLLLAPSLCLWKPAPLLPRTKNVVTPSHNAALCDNGVGSAGLGYRPGSMLGPCPDNGLLCGTDDVSQGWLECGELDCSARGDCLRGQCRCHLGFVGENCEHSICIGSPSCPAGKVCRLSSPLL
jgi:hypothetical protein